MAFFSGNFLILKPFFSHLKAIISHQLKCRKEIHDANPNKVNKTHKHYKTFSILTAIQFKELNTTTHWWMCNLWFLVWFALQLRASDDIYSHWKYWEKEIRQCFVGKWVFPRKRLKNASSQSSIGIMVFGMQNISVLFVKCIRFYCLSIIRMDAIRPCLGLNARLYRCRMNLILLFINGRLCLCARVLPKRMHCHFEPKRKHLKK